MFYFTGYTQALSKSSCDFLSLLLKSTELKISKYERKWKKSASSTFLYIRKLILINNNSQKIRTTHLW